MRFGAGLRASDVAFRTDGCHLVAALADGSRLMMRNAVSASEGWAPTRVDAFDFDGETLTFAQAQALATDFVVGDAMFDMLRPTGSRLYEDGDEMRRSVEKIRASGAKTIWVGHGNPIPNN